MKINEMVNSSKFEEYDRKLWDALLSIEDIITEFVKEKGGEVSSEEGDLGFALEHQRNDLYEEKAITGLRVEKNNGNGRDYILYYRTEDSDWNVVESNDVLRFDTTIISMFNFITESFIE